MDKATLNIPAQTGDDSLALIALRELSFTWKPALPSLFRSKPSSVHYDLTSSTRLEASSSDKPLDLECSLQSIQTQVQHLEDREETILYLAYGSNLCRETFQGRRGIKPISAINVIVPDLRLTFDLPGFPYAEPCFANSGPRDASKDGNRQSIKTTEVYDEKSPLLRSEEPTPLPPHYHKDAWTKGLIGTVYEVTPSDYAHIIATEGAGSSYHDILIPCHPLSTNPSDTVPTHPTTKVFYAHTLYAPPSTPPPPGSPLPPPSAPSSGDRLRRPDGSYAQPSARYLNLITSGAAERDLPTEYCDYLSTIHPYTPTTAAQRMGAFIFLSLWSPIITFVFALNAVFGDEKTGRSPSWVALLASGVFKGVWASYDGWFLGVFGDGERSLGDGGRDKDGDGDDEKEGKALEERLRRAGLIGREDRGMVEESGSGGYGAVVETEKGRGSV